MLSPDEYQTNRCDSSTYDLILMDCQMPKIDGYEAKKAIRRSESGIGLHIPIVVPTAHAMSSESGTSFLVRADDIPRLVQGDSGRVVQIFANLISNSIKFTIYLIVFYCQHRFFPLSHIQLSTPGNSRHQAGRMLTVDSNGCFIAVSAYEDQLALFTVSESAGSDIIDKRIFYPSETEGNTSTTRHVTSISGTIWSMCFISKEFCQPSKEHKPVLAILLNRRDSFLINYCCWNGIQRNMMHV